MTEKHDQKIARFWKWFQQKRDAFDALVGTDDPFWDTALTRLKRINQHLCFELSAPDDNDREFIVTVEGRVKLFPLADSVVAQAPPIHGWRFVSLKPPRGFEFTMTYEGITLDPRALWFMPLTNAARPRELALRIGIPDYDRRRGDEVVCGLYVLLETALGERQAASDIQHVEAAPLPDDPESAGFIMLLQLPSFIEWHKRKT